MASRRTQRDWLAALEAVGVPGGPINRLDAVMADPQVIARGLRVDMPHPMAGTVAQIVAPIKLSATPLVPERPPPLLAEHTESVLRERLALDDATLDRLAAAGIVQTRPH